jgi:hypothetical protein
VNHNSDVPPFTVFHTMKVRTFTSGFCTDESGSSCSLPEVTSLTGVCSPEGVNGMQDDSELEPVAGCCEHGGMS